MLHVGFVSAQYWQQAIDYKINVELDHDTAQYQGTEEIVYTNNSPETLKKFSFTSTSMHLDQGVKWRYD